MGGASLKTIPHFNQGMLPPLASPEIEEVTEEEKG
jgi:hypothetical protein